MIDAKVHVLSPFLLFLHKACRETAAASIHDRTALFLLDRRVKTQILPTREAEGPERLIHTQLLSTIFHERLQLC